MKRKVFFAALFIGAGAVLAAAPAVLAFTQGAPFSVGNASSTVPYLLVDTTGNVGLGTTSPQQILDIKIPSAPEAYFGKVCQNVSGYVGIAIGNNGISDCTHYTLLSDGSNLFLNAAGGEMLFGSRNNQSMVLSSSGSLGLGTTSPFTALSVTGSVNATNEMGFLINGTRTVRNVLTANKNYFVNASTGSDSNDCEAATTGGGHGPCATISHAVSVVYATTDSNGNSITINVAAGTYTGEVDVFGALLGNVEYQIQGAGSGSVTVQAPSGQYAFYAKDQGVTTISGMTLSCASGAAGELLSAQTGILDVSSDVKLGTCSGGGAQMSVTEGGYMNLIAPITISGNAAMTMAAQFGGEINLGSQTISIPSALTETIFAGVYYGGTINAGGVTISGAGVAGTTGTRYAASYGGILDTNGTDPNTIFPGNANGTTYVTSGSDAAPDTLTISTAGDLGIGSTGAPKGITLYDDTGLGAYCVHIHAGALVAAAGACQ